MKNLHFYNYIVILIFINKEQVEKNFYLLSIFSHKRVVVLKVKVNHHNCQVKAAKSNFLFKSSYEED